MPPNPLAMCMASPCAACCFTTCTFPNLNKKFLTPLPNPGDAQAIILTMYNYDYDYDYEMVLLRHTISTMYHGIIFKSCKKHNILQ